ncbi:MAG: hypothetical protein ACLQUZ_15580 [Rhizomicrobium sp.]
MALTKTEERLLGHIIDLVTLSSELASAIIAIAHTTPNGEQKLAAIRSLEKANAQIQTILSNTARTAQGVE